MERFGTGCSELETSRLWSSVGKQLTSKYPLGTSSSSGKDSDLFIRVVTCLWLVGWLVGGLLKHDCGVILVKFCLPLCSMLKVFTFCCS